MSDELRDLLGDEAYESLPEELREVGEKAITFAKLITEVNGESVPAVVNGQKGIVVITPKVLTDEQVQTITDNVIMPVTYTVGVKLSYSTLIETICQMSGKKIESLEINSEGKINLSLVTTVAMSPQVDQSLSKAVDEILTKDGFATAWYISLDGKVVLEGKPATAITEDQIAGLRKRLEAAQTVEDVIAGL
jgi:hypothetical protein